MASRLVPSKSAVHELLASARILRELPKLLPAVGFWSPARLVERNAAIFGGAPALIYVGHLVPQPPERFTWSEVNTRANQYASWLYKRGISRGAVVAILMDNRPDYLFLQLGLGKLGAVAALVNTNVTGAPLAHALSAGRPKLIIAGAEHEAALRSIAGDIRWPGSTGDVPIVIHDERPADVVACGTADVARTRLPRAADATSYIYTSGTTGLPKAAIITNQRWMGASAYFARVIHECGPGDVLYVTTPLYHSSAQWMGWGACMVSGAAMALRRKFSASSFWSDVREVEATHFLYIGEICRYLMNTKVSPDERSHRLKMGVGNGLRADVWSAFQARFGVPLMREFYGATEGNALLANLEGRPGMVGRLRIGQRLLKCDPATGQPARNASGLCVTCSVGDTGLLVARINPFTNFEGYLDTGANEKKVVRDVGGRGDAYFNSGDLLTLHDDDWLSFADRVGDTFRWKGENVSTAEVAEVLNGAAGVLQANVYGVEVPGADGRAGMASLELGDGFDVGAFAAYVSAKLPGYQRPMFIRLQREMSVTATFKQQKVDYRAEGYDPTRCSDPLYYLEGATYVPIDEALFERIRRGELVAARPALSGEALPSTTPPRRTGAPAGPPETG